MSAASEPRRTPQGPWAGEWVADRLGIAVRTTEAPLGVALDDLVGLAVRRNPRRAHLLVSQVLGKHVPTDPRLVYGAGLLLGTLVAQALTGTGEGEGNQSRTDGARRQNRAGGDLLRLALGDVPGSQNALVTHMNRLRGLARVPDGTVVLGYAETATALGHLVADAIGAATLHSTRRPIAGVTPVGGFEEEHSHATSHLLLPEDADLLAAGGPLVLVDDELSTGTTALNTIVELHALHPRDHYVIAALVDLRSDADRARMDRVATDLGVRIDMVALAAGHVDLPEGILEAGQALVASTEVAQRDDLPTRSRRPAKVARVHLPAPDGLRDGGRHGFTPTDRERLEDYLADVAAHVVDHVGRSPRRVHVLGFEELMYAPLRLAQALTGVLRSDDVVTYSTTTRSPVLAVADDGYAIRSRLVFPAHDDPADGPGDRYAYNVTPATADDEPFGTVVLVIDEAGDTPALAAPGGLLDQLRATAEHVVLVVIPDYRPARVPDATDLHLPATGETL